MLSYRKLAMRVLGRPLHTGGGIDSPRPASQRAAAFVLTAALLTGAAFPAFAGTYYIEDIFNQIECRSNNREFWRIINLFHFEPANIYLLYR